METVKIVDFVLKFSVPDRDTPPSPAEALAKAGFAKVSSGFGGRSPPEECEGGIRYELHSLYFKMR
ncbi:MAG: hypothetical protein A2V72_00700 [Candidatus Nealsonbacteria bacterium RBG_13_37_56]|uniref:Uncharacterized protein n=1 Tax=Candidatus Nealsonbacteria bacterium RBG_13_37_56 TaxID=1801661 RepID=A0A1G2DWB3_9BACT|nr:MAG: hypothetical protein A2V72_00700 [Candidatus Nealsonbacteria bacterium RBG_13_37_56]